LIENELEQFDLENTIACNNDGNYIFWKLWSSLIEAYQILDVGLHAGLDANALRY